MKIILVLKSRPEILGFSSVTGWSKTVTCYIVRVSRSEGQDKVSLMAKAKSMAPLDLLAMCLLEE